MAAAFTYIGMNEEEAQNGSVLRNAFDLTNLSVQFSCSMKTSTNEELLKFPVRWC